MSNDTAGQIEDVAIKYRLARFQRTIGKRGKHMQTNVVGGTKHADTERNEKMKGKDCISFGGNLHTDGSRGMLSN